MKFKNKLTGLIEEPHSAMVEEQMLKSALYEAVKVQEEKPVVEKTTKKQSK